MALRIGISPSRPSRRCVPAGRHFRSPPAHYWQRGADGQRLRCPRDPHHRAGRGRRREPVRHRRPLPQRVRSSVGRARHVSGTSSPPPVPRTTPRPPKKCSWPSSRTATSTAVPASSSMTPSGSVSSRPLRRGHLPALRLRGGPRRPMRQLLEDPRCHRSDRTSVKAVGSHSRPA